MCERREAPRRFFFNLITLSRIHFPHMASDPGCSLESARANRAAPVGRRVLPVDMKLEVLLWSPTTREGGVVKAFISCVRTMFNSLGRMATPQRSAHLGSAGIPRLFSADSVWPLRQPEGCYQRDPMGGEPALRLHQGDKHP